MASASSIDWQAVREKLALNERRLAQVLTPDPDQIRAVLEQRAAVIRARKDQVAAQKLEEQTTMLLVRVGAQKYGLLLPALDEVIRISSITAVPQMEKDVLGVLNVRGELYCAIRLADSFGDAGDGTSGLTWGVVLRHPRLRLVLGVSAVERIIHIPASQLRDAAADAIIRVGDDPVRVFDSEALLQRFERSLSPSSASL
jgi:chemotaxis signal transduction protein